MYVCYIYIYIYVSNLNSSGPGSKATTYRTWGPLPVTNNVLLVKIEGPVWYTIYHHLPVVEGVNKPLY